MRSHHTLALGLGVTLAIVGLERLGVLEGLERRSVDLRDVALSDLAAPMTRQIVHVDIDDSALDRIGRWPWDRSILADAVDELRAAGARTIAIDLLLVDPQDRVVTAGGEVGLDHDTRLGEAIGAAPVILPVVLHQGALFDEMWLSPSGATELETLLAVLGEDVQRDDDEVARLAGLTGARRDRFRRRPIEFRRVAAWRVLEQAVANGEPLTWTLFERRMTPRRNERSGAYPEEPILRSAWQQFLGWLALQPKLRAHDAARGTHLDRAPIPALAAAAMGTGFVNVDARKDRDGVVRELAMAEEAPGGSVLQFGLAAAAHQRGLPPASIEIHADRLVVGTTTLPLREGRLWIDWPATTTRPRWEGLLRQYPDAASDAGHLSIREIVELARARRTRTSLRERMAETTKLILAYAGVELDDLDDLDGATARAAAADEVEFTLADAPPAGTDAGSVTGSSDGSPADDQERAFADHVHNCRLWVELRAALADAGTRIARSRARLGEEVAGKLVFVGWTATGAAADFFPTAIDTKTPGVVIHAAVADMVLSGRGILLAPPWLARVLTLLLGIACTLASGRYAAVRSTSLALGLLGGVAGLVLVWYEQHRIVLPIVAPMLGGAGAWTVCTAVQAALLHRDRNRISKQFRSRVSVQLVDFLAENPGALTVGGEEREMTIMFGDLAGFTTLSETLGGALTVSTLNRYLGDLTAVLVVHQAYVNKFLGDGFMAFWSAFAPEPDQAILAAEAAVACHEAMGRLNGDPVHVTLPDLELRLGVATGRVIVGDCGAPPALHDYTVIGDSVNLAARLESANKQFGTRNLVDGRTREGLAGSTCVVRPIGRIVVVGQSRPVDVFEIMAPGAPGALVDLTTQAVHAFTSGDLGGARTALDDMERRFGPNAFTGTYLRAIDLAGDSFDGVLRLQAK